jgi:tetratricopeptide (TPR) repeat protein
MSLRLRSTASLSALLLLASALVAQTNDGFNNVGKPGGPTAYSTTGSILFLTVHDSKGAKLDRQALAKVSNSATKDVFWQSTQDNSETSFGDLTAGKYDIEVSAVGFLTKHQELLVSSGLNTYKIDVTLTPDPNAVDLDALDAQIPSKARKEAYRGVTALKSGDYKQAQKRLESAYKLAPSSSDINFFLGYVFLQNKDFAQAKTYLSNAITNDPRNVRALTTLGKLELQQRDFAAAKSTLERAVATGPDYSNAHRLLAEAYLKQHDFEKARQEAQAAIDSSKGSISSAYSTLGQALANLGQNEAAIVALRTYLQSSSDRPNISQVNRLISQLEARAANSAVAQAPSVVALLPDTQTDETDDLRLAMKTWEPPGVDDSKPAVTAGVTCPSEKVITQAGLRVKELVENVSRFQAIEELVHQRVDELGHPTTNEKRQFNYLAEISDANPGFLEVNEYRGSHSGAADFPDGIATRGLPALALIFHPIMRENFQMLCEGLGNWHGTAAWLVHFRQREDKPNRIHAYRIGADVFRVDLKGRAWIAASDNQIIHMEADLVNPARNIRLLTEHESVDYGPVTFPKKKTQLWLPKNAELYLDFQRRRYYRRHSFDHFMLFTVDTEEERKEPVADVKQSPAPAGDAAPNE